MEEQRTPYRAPLKEIDDKVFIVGVEKNVVDPAASKRVFQERLRSDKKHTGLLLGYKKKAQAFFKKAKRKNAERSKTVRKLKDEIDNLKKEILARETELREESIIFSIVPYGYRPMNEEEAKETEAALGKLKDGERLELRAE